jgi:hypothetical protein
LSFRLHLFIAVQCKKIGYVPIFKHIHLHLSLEFMDCAVYAKCVASSGWKPVTSRFMFILNSLFKG